MNTIVLLAGLMINMEDISEINRGYCINNDLEFVYYIEVINDSRYITTLKYDDKYTWYYDIDVIKSFKYKTIPEKPCLEVLPGIPCQ